jgi:hypothetical protein
MWRWNAHNEKKSMLHFPVIRQPRRYPALTVVSEVVTKEICVADLKQQTSKENSVGFAFLDGIGMNDDVFHSQTRPGNFCAHLVNICQDALWYLSHPITFWGIRQLRFGRMNERSNPLNDALKVEAYALGLRLVFLRHTETPAETFNNESLGSLRPAP